MTACYCCSHAVYLLPTDANCRYSNNKELADWLGKPPRTIIEYSTPMQNAKLIHWSENHTRVLTHFYAFLTHASTRVNNYHKRLIRDKLHYNDDMYCKASQILTLLRAESPDGSFSSMHIRRGDFQFSEVTYFRSIIT
jgi:GDP-fucose protein O-fucosyltransferase